MGTLGLGDLGGAKVEARDEAVHGGEFIEEVLPDQL